MQEGSTLENEDNNTAAEKRQACVASLYRRYALALFEYISRHIATISDAEDILTEVFIGALRYDVTRLSEDERRAWLWTVARNKINDQYRRLHRQPQLSLEALLDTLEDGTTPEELMLQREEVALLQKYLQNLSAVQQEVLELRFIGGLRCTEIAVLCHKREGAIRSTLSRALNELRKSYKR